MCKRFRTTLLMAAGLLWTTAVGAVSRPLVIAFGKWTSAKWSAGAVKGKPLELKIRGLFVDTRLKEYTTGVPPDVTDRLFVVRRVFRLNDTFPTESAQVPRWVWERGGWLLVDRVTGRVTQITSPAFDLLFDRQLVS